MRKEALARLEAAVEPLIARDPILARCLADAGPPAIGLRPSGFPALLRIILEQQVSTVAAAAMWSRLCGRIDPMTPASFLSLDHAELRRCGFTRQKAAYARGLAADVLAGRLDFDAVDAMDDEAAIAELVRLKGIGRWSAEVYLLLSLGRGDIWPAADLALATGLRWLTGRDDRPTFDALRVMGDAWRPYRSTAAWLIWHYYLTVAARMRRRPG